jgi:hypothetical protein
MAPRTLFSRAFDFAIEIAMGSLSMPMTRRAPKRFAAIAKIPLPVPRSTSDQLRFQWRVSSSKRRSDITVVACSPVPNAVEAGFTRGLSSHRNTFGAGRSILRVMTNRFPILIGSGSRRANRLSQWRGNFSTRPPNCLSSARDRLRELHVISSCNRFRSGLRTITSWPSACD